jgi:chromosomal replication initiator protein
LPVFVCRGVRCSARIGAPPASGPETSDAVATGCGAAAACRIENKKRQERFGWDMTDDTWGNARAALKSTVGQDAYRNWIEPLEICGIDDGVARFRVPTSFMGTWVARNFGEEILKLLRASGSGVERLAFEVAADRCVADRPPAAARNGETRDEAEAAGSPLDPRFTFDSFVVGKPNALAHAAARRVGEGGAVTFNPLFLYGGVGLGKTHLMHAIAWEITARDPAARVLYLSAEKFMNRFIQALRFKDMIGFKEMFRSVDVLMVDDVQFIAGKESTQEEFFHTFNALVEQNRQIIISADRAPGEINGLEERIKSRLQWGLLVDLHPTDYELRLGILQQKVAAQSALYPELEIAPGVLEFLAHRISTNVRVLEGALTRLFAFASLVGCEITLDLAQDCLADILRASDRKVTIEEIIRKVAEHYNLRMSDLLSTRRTRTIARPRQVAMYLSKKLTSKSLPEIGRRFGGRDHTTVIHAVRKIEDLRAHDSQIAEDVELLRRMLEA